MVRLEETYEETYGNVLTGRVKVLPEEQTGSPGKMMRKD